MQNTNINILFVINQLFKGGAETALVELLKRLVDINISVALVVYDQVDNHNAISLIPEIPPEVTLIKAQNNKFSKLKTINNLYPKNVLNFLNENAFDLAVSYGEWFSPELVMKFANAKQKAVWLHSDITKSLLVNKNELFAWDQETNCYICVSESFRKITSEQYPFMAERTKVVHNCINAKQIRLLADEPTEINIPDNIPIILSVGNLRPEKNYIRAVKAAQILHNKKLPFLWICVGAFSHEQTVQNVKKAIKDAGLESQMKLIGPSKNPYAIMKKAAILVSSSDHESWSMVIAEAKTLALPVIATKTIGATEQLSHKHNALLCDFSETDLADKIELFMTSDEIQKRLKKNLKQDGSLIKPEVELLDIISKNANPPKKERLLYLIDDTNYRGGAHTATSLLLTEMSKRGIPVEVFSGVTPSVETRNRFAPVRISSLDSNGERGSWESIPFRDCLFSREFSMREKYYKFRQAIKKRLPGTPKLWHDRTAAKISDFLSGYGRVCVMSEGSAFRDIVAQSNIEHRYQCIHTNYRVWSKLNDYTRKLTSGDIGRFSKMEKIMLVSKRNRDEFVQIFPELESRCVSIRNVIKKPDKVQRMDFCGGKIRLLSVARLEWEKDIPRMIRLAARMIKDKLEFDWRILGYSSAYDALCNQAFDAGVEKCFHLEGQSSNPYSAYQEADLFILLSHYEGLPNTVYEALLSGVPVFATNVGGISEQIEQNITGILVEDDEDAIYNELKKLIKNPSEIDRMRSETSHYTYDNEEVVDEYIKIFGMEKK